MQRSQQVEKELMDMKGFINDANTYYTEERAKKVVKKRRKEKILYIYLCLHLYLYSHLHFICYYHFFLGFAKYIITTATV